MVRHSGQAHGPVSCGVSTEQPNRYAQDRYSFAPRGTHSRDRLGTVKRTTEPCPTCGHPMPPARTCARVDCGATFRFKRADAIYCSARCARIVAQRELRRRQRQM